MTASYGKNNTPALSSNTMANNFWKTMNFQFPQRSVCLFTKPVLIIHKK